jgi:hypothetical protein
MPNMVFFLHFSRFLKKVMIQLIRVGSGIMSRTTFILIGISYYILSIIIIIVVLNTINKKERKKYSREISNLEREKNLII